MTLFLMQYWGGPSTYSDQRGHPRLRMRHAPFRVGAAERDAWLRHMRAAVESLRPAGAASLGALGLPGAVGTLHGQHGRLCRRSRILDGYNSLIGLNATSIPGVARCDAACSPPPPCCALAGATGAGPASADVAQSKVVSANPVDFTPHVLNGTVWAARRGRGHRRRRRQLHHRSPTVPAPRPSTGRTSSRTGCSDGVVRSFAPVGRRRRLRAGRRPEQHGLPRRRVQDRRRRGPAGPGPGRRSANGARIAVFTREDQLG